MNSFLLMEALRELLEKELQPLPLCSGKKLDGENILVPVTVHLGSLPPKTGNQPGYDAPFVLIQAMSGHQDEDNFAHVTVALRLCVWHGDAETCENDLHNLVALCRRAVLRHRSVALKGKYVFTADESSRLAPWARPDEQALQFGEAYILTHWKMMGVE